MFFKDMSTIVLRGCPTVNLQSLQTKGLPPPFLKHVAIWWEKGGTRKSMSTWYQLKSEENLIFQMKI